MYKTTSVFYGVSFHVIRVEIITLHLPCQGLGEEDVSEGHRQIRDQVVHASLRLWRLGAFIGLGGSLQLLPWRVVCCRGLLWRLGRQSKLFPRDTGIATVSTRG